SDSNRWVVNTTAFCAFKEKFISLIILVTT
ncbi:unnamed protein product, partial [marine sediment metagenome]